MGLGLRVEGLGLRVEGLRFRVVGLGVMVEGLGFRTLGSWVWFRFEGLCFRAVSVRLPLGILPCWLFLQGFGL